MDCFRQIYRLIRSPFKRTQHRVLEIVSNCDIASHLVQTLIQVSRDLPRTFERRSYQRSLLMTSWYPFKDFFEAPFLTSTQRNNPAQPDGIGEGRHRQHDRARAFNTG
ncbi:hypothetical protein BJX68DRAFT_30052 [Aspergillus pseudodeflectus]|uniref:Uncharacterized protein n=1 Tax=Aspergillus pseudodeflectus TaxID=176178 RepID=A0ABR4KRV9_9EURO